MIWKKKKFWGTLVAVALLAYCVKDISYHDIRELALRLDYWYLIPAVVCSFLVVALKALRWRVMVLPQKKIPVGRAVAVYTAGQVVNIVMPALTGQLGRIFLFSRMEGLRKTFIFSTIVLEVLFDAVTLVVFLLLTSLAFVFPEEYRSASYVIGAVTVLMLVALYLILTFEGRLEDFGRRHFRDRWPGFYISVKKFIRSFTKGIETLRSSQHLATTLGLSMLLWGAHMFVVFFLFKSFAFGLPLAASAVVMIINTLALMVPITPGNAGTFEVAVSTSLAAFSIDRSDAVLCALALHLIDILPLWVLGAAFLKYKKVSIKDIRSQHGDEDVLNHLGEDGVLVEKKRTA